MTSKVVGPLCSGSIQPRDTIPVMAAWLREHHPEAWTQAFSPACGFPVVPAEAQDDPRHPWWDSEEAQDVAFVLIEALEEEAPEGFWFGAHPDDGACLGFWEHDIL